MADKSLRQLQEERLIQKEILDTILKQAKSDKERLAIKKNLADADEKTRDAYKDALDTLKEINEQVKTIKSENKTKISDLATEASQLKGLSGLQASLVQFEQDKIIIQKNNIEVLVIEKNEEKMLVEVMRYGDGPVIDILLKELRAFLRGKPYRVDIKLDQQLRTDAEPVPDYM